MFKFKILKTKIILEESTPISLEKIMVNVSVICIPAFCPLAPLLQFKIVMLFGTIALDNMLYN